MKRITLFFMMLLSFLSLFRSAYADLIIPTLAETFGYSVLFILTILLVLVIEAIFIKRLFSIKPAFSFVLSVIINLLSSIVGLYFIVFIDRFMSKYFSMYDPMFHKKLHIINPIFYISFIGSFILTLIFESVLLFLSELLLKKRVKLQAIFATSVLMNLMSYAVLFLFVYLTVVVIR